MFFYCVMPLQPLGNWAFSCIISTKHCHMALSTAVLEPFVRLYHVPDLYMRASHEVARLICVKLNSLAKICGRLCSSMEYLTMSYSLGDGLV